MKSEESDETYVEIPLKKRVSNALTVAALVVVLIVVVAGHYTPGDDLDVNWQIAVAVYSALGIGAIIFALTNKKRRIHNPSKIRLSDSQGEITELRPLNESIKNGWASASKTVAGLISVLAILAVLYLLYIGIAALPISVAVIIGAAIIALAIKFR